MRELGCPSCNLTKIVVSAGPIVSLRCKECSRSFTLQPMITLNELRSILSEAKYEEEREKRQA